MANAIKVFFKGRGDLVSKPQADTVIVERYREFLTVNGVEIVDNETAADIIHFFGLAICQSSAIPTKPFCISPLIDIDDATLAYAEAVGNSLMRYTRDGQVDSTWTSPAASVTAARTINLSKEWFTKAAKIFIQGKTEQSLLEKQFGSLTTFAIAPMGLPEFNKSSGEAFTAQYGIKDFILCVARIEPRKNQLMLLKAFENSSLPIVLVDGGMNANPAYEQEVRSFKRPGKTIITGKVEQSMITAAIAAAKVHVLPSFYEIPGVVSLEALRHGCPVVATRGGSTADYLANEALYCNPADTDSVYNAVMAAYYAPHQASSKKVAHWKEIVETVKNQYDSVVRPVTARNAMQTVNNTAKALDLEVEIEIEKAEDMALANNLQGALATLRTLEQNYPSDSRAQRALAAVLLMTGAQKEAKARFNLSYKLDAQDTKTLRGLALCSQTENDVSGAYELLVKAVMLAPQDSSVIVELLKLSYQLKKFDVIEKTLADYCMKGDCGEGMRFSYAGVLFEQQKYAAALTICDQILANDPASNDAQQLKQRIEEAQGKTAQPVAATATVLTPVVETAAQKTSLASAVTQVRYDPTPNPESLLAQLEEFRRNLKLEELKKGLEAAYSIEHKLSAVQKQRILLLTADYQVLSGNLSEAKRVFEEVAKEDPHSTRALCGLGALAANAGTWAEAQRYFTQAISLDPRQDVAYAGLGMCAKQDNQLERSWGFYRTALSINPENMRALLGLLEIGYPMKRFDDIERALKGYLELHPADTEFSYSLAGCLFAQEKLTEASNTLHTILTFKPDDSRALELSAAIESKRGPAIASNATR